MLHLAFRFGNESLDLSLLFVFILQRRSGKVTLERRVSVTRPSRPHSTGPSSNFPLFLRSIFHLVRCQGKLMEVCWCTSSIDQSRIAILAEIVLLTTWSACANLHDEFNRLSAFSSRFARRLQAASSSPAAREFFFFGELLALLPGFHSREALIARRRSIVRWLTRHDTYLPVAKIYFGHLFSDSGPAATDDSASWRLRASWLLSFLVHCEITCARSCS